jgi:C4-dicarboxylate-specific signal transduction histidine kinase
MKGMAVIARTLSNVYPQAFLLKLVGSENRIIELPLSELGGQSGVALFVPALGKGSSFEAFQEIIAHLRGFLRKDGPVREIDINHALGDVLHIVEPEAARRGIAIECDRAAQQLSVRADHVHLQQVLLNLALNGMDAMQDTTRSRRMVFQTVRRTDTEVEVAVLDSGTGIPENKLKDIFESFVTTKQHGTGLGLSIARTIVEMYGGRIWAENRQDGGAAFRFVLPLVRTAA